MDRRDSRSCWLGRTPSAVYVDDHTSRLFMRMTTQVWV